MSQKKNVSEIKKLLDELPKKKTLKEKTYILLQIKLELEMAERSLDETQARRLAGIQKSVIKNALKRFLGTLDKIFDAHEELGDTDVRDRLSLAIHKGFIYRQPRPLPEKFGMFSQTGEKRVRAAVKKFLAHAEVVAASKSLKTPAARLLAFQDNDVKSAEGNTYSEYFWDADKPARPNTQSDPRK
jgi:hypothetical protein